LVHGNPQNPQKEQHPQQRPVSITALEITGRMLCARHLRPDLLQPETRLKQLSVGLYGQRAGDSLLLAHSDLERPIEKRFYFSGPYHSWHGSPTEQVYIAGASPDRQQQTGPTHSAGQPLGRYEEPRS
jgi:hypothetical protein